MNGSTLLAKAVRELSRGSGDVIMTERHANHMTVTYKNAHGRIGRLTVPTRRINQATWQNSRTQMFRELRLLPGEHVRGGRHAR